MQAAPDPPTVGMDRAGGLPDFTTPLDHGFRDAAHLKVPRALTSLIGRDQVVQEVHDLLLAAALVTLIGAGGVGKTSIALKVANEWAHTESVWFVALAAVTNVTSVTQVIARAVGVKEAPDTPLEETLVRSLSSRSGLLVLDNCEHLLDACMESVHPLLRACRGLRVLATSRQALGLPGELSYPVLPLETPTLAMIRAIGDREIGKEHLAILMSSAAIELFVQRARAAAPSFRLGASNATAIAEICKRLDGIPLAIELAAARMKSLSAAQVLDRMSDRFQLLSSGMRGVAPHHQTLRALVDWSYDLLSEWEQHLLHRLAVFAGGWTLETAEQVCSDSGETDTQARPDAPRQLALSQICDLLASLVDKSLVQVDLREEVVRYSLLDTIQQYALDKLDADKGASVRRRHCHYYSNLLQRLDEDVHGARMKACFQRFDAEYDNIRAALTWSVTERRAGDRTESLLLCRYILDLSGLRS